MLSELKSWTTRGFSPHFSSLGNSPTFFPRCKVNQMPWGALGLTLIQLPCTPELVTVSGGWPGEWITPKGQYSISFCRITWDWVVRMAVTNRRRWLTLSSDIRQVQDWGNKDPLANCGLELCVWACEWAPTHLCSDHNAMSGLASKGALYPVHLWLLAPSAVTCPLCRLHATCLTHLWRWLYLSIQGI